MGAASAFGAMSLGGAQPAAPAAPAAAPALGGGGDICPKCNKKVYFAEQVKGAGATYHKLCFKCTTCNKMLDSSLCADKDNALYCKSCYGANFGPKVCQMLSLMCVRCLSRDDHH